MVRASEQNLTTKIVAVAAIATLVFMGLSLYLAPNEGHDNPSEYYLKLDPPQVKTKYVQSTIGSSVSYYFTIEHENGEYDKSTQEIILWVENMTYGGPEADEDNWEFEFVGATPVGLPSEGKWKYLVPQFPYGMSIELKVTFLSDVVSEHVGFTINGTEKATGNEPDLLEPHEYPIPDEQEEWYHTNYTRLPAVDCFDEVLGYLMVYSVGECGPFVEFLDCDPVELMCDEFIERSIRIWNHGSSDDNIPVISWEMWFDSNNDGEIDHPDDTDNSSSFEVIFEYPAGGEYELYDPILLPSGESETLKVLIRLNEIVPTGQYLLKITVESQNCFIPYSALSSDENSYDRDMYVDPILVTITNPVEGFYYRPGNEITMAYTTDPEVDPQYVRFWYEDAYGQHEILDADPNVDGIQWDTSDIPGPFCDEGFYCVDVWVEVNYNYCRQGESEKIEICFCEELNPEPCVITIKINEGWNLISIGVELDSLGNESDPYTASVLADEINIQAGSDIIKYVVRWEGFGYDAGEFHEYVVLSGLGENFMIERGEGYYLYSTSPFEVEFLVVGDCPECETFDLMECWNLVGYESMDVVDVGEWADIIDEYAGWPVVQAIVKWDKSTEDYLPWYPGLDDDLFQVRPGEAYWIFSATTLYGVPFPPGITDPMMKKDSVDCPDCFP